MTLKISQKGLILVAVPLLCEILFVSILIFLLNQAEHDAQRANRAKLVILQAQSFSKGFFDAGASLLAYTKTGSPLFAQRFEAICQRLPEELTTLETLTTSNNSQREALTRIRKLSTRCLEIFAEVKQGAELGDFSPAFIETKELTAEIEGLLSQLLSAVHKFSDEERQRQKDAPQDAAHSRLLVQQLLILGVAMNILIAFVLARFFSKNIARRLLTLDQNSTRLQSGQPLAAPLTGSDEIAEVDKRFHEMANALNEASRLKQEFLAMISHDMRSPLTALNLTLELLEGGSMGQLQPEATQRIERSKHSISRLLILINELLLLEKLETGKSELRKTVVPLNFLVDECLETVRPLADDKSIVLTTDNIDCRVLADPDKLVQVLINLLSNAIKFSEPGKTVSLSAQKQNNFTEIRIRDQGSGITKEKQSLLFNRFSQTNKADELKGGFGLGLAICKAIIEQHGGQIGVDSEEGRGSTFWFRLPD
ncbi:MAG: HAMP domain-containing histidine kinase [Candidatus Obscuribacterales bacterium]|nr:HAMP domain-containing histidine kinase [Candidatus Obscuribacterales bacterium]